MRLLDHDNAGDSLGAVRMKHLSNHSGASGMCRFEHHGAHERLVVQDLPGAAVKLNQQVSC
jgi:hypothetical protein